MAGLAESTVDRHITSREPNAQNEKHNQILQLPQNIQITLGRIRIIISENGLAGMLGVGCERVSEEHLEIDAAFQHRKRGVETKLILADTANPRDETLFKNIAKAHHYFDLIRAGKTYAEIAAAEGVSKHRVYKLVDLAFPGAGCRSGCICRFSTSGPDNQMVAASRQSRALG